MSGPNSCVSMAIISSIGQHAIERPDLLGIERHEFDKAHFDVAFTAEADQRNDIGLGQALDRDRIQLDHFEAGC